MTKKNNVTSLSFVILFLLACQPSWAEPKWAEITPKHSKNHINMACEGKGPSEDISAREAMYKCLAMASDEFISDFHVQSMTIETQKDSGYHEEITEDKHIEGLVCDIQNQETKEFDGSYQTWVLCDFNTTTAKAVKGKRVVKREPAVVKSDTFSVLMVTIPKCDDIMVRSTDAPRIVECANNPSTFVVHPGDKEFIVRANGYVPRHLFGEDVLKPVVKVYLERE